MPIRNAYLADGASHPDAASVEPSAPPSRSLSGPPSLSPSGPPALASSPPPPLAVRSRRAGFAALVLAVVGALLYLKALPCMFARVFHTPCPGCGSTRAVFAFLHGDWQGVLRYNPLGPVLAVLLGVLAAQSLVSVFVHGDFRAAARGRVGLVVKRGLVVVLGLEVALWVARFFGAFGGPVPV